MIVVDASVLVAHFTQQDAHHEAAAELLRKAAGEVLLAHPLTLAEVLVGGVRNGRGQEMVTDLGSLGVEPAGRDDGEALRLATLRVSTGLRLPDCCVLDTALANAGVLATFDAVLTRIARSLGVRVLP